MIIKGNKLTEKVSLKFHKSFVNIIYYRFFTGFLPAIKE